MRIEFGRAFIAVSEPTCDLVQIHAGLRQPGAAGVPQDVRRHISQSSPRACSIE